MELGLGGKVALVVGATQGLGRATALKLAEEGAAVALIARTASDLRDVEADATACGVSAASWSADFTDADRVDAVVDEVHRHFGSIDVLVNTVGVCEGTTDALSAPDDLWQQAFDSVLMTAVRACRAVVPVMRTHGGGAIVNVSAMSMRHYVPGIAHYSAMKIALAHFTKNLAKTCRNDNIRANAVMPGWIDSEQVDRILTREMEETGLDRHAVFLRHNAEKLEHSTFADRIGSPEEYADVIAFLVSDRASYVNGAWVNVDGGSNF